MQQLLQRLVLTEVLQVVRNLSVDGREHLVAGTATSTDDRVEKFVQFDEEFVFLLDKLQLALINQQLGDQGLVVELVVGDLKILLVLLGGVDLI